MDLIDNSLGFNAFAFRGEQGWHGKGQPIEENDDAETIRQKAGAAFDLELAPVKFDRKITMPDGSVNYVTETAENRFALYRSDTGSVLNTVTKRYKPVQTSTMFNQMKKWCDEGGYQIETAGVLCGGGRYFVTANTHNVLMLPGQDKIAQYLNLATSSDGSMLTEGFTGETRIVCNNTLQAARHENVLMCKNRHSTVVDFDAMSIKLQVVSEAWKTFCERAKILADTITAKEETVNLIIMAYNGFKTREEVEAYKKKVKDGTDEKARKKIAEFWQRMTSNINTAPGADLTSARGMLWGVVNAVTYDIDHNGGGRTEEARFISSQWGKGNEIKTRIWELCNQAANKEIDLAAAA